MKLLAILILVLLISGSANAITKTPWSTINTTQPFPTDLTFTGKNITGINDITFDAAGSTIDFNARKLADLGAPTTSGDAVRYQDLYTKINKSGDTMSGALAMGANKITGVANGDEAQDAFTISQGWTKINKTEMPYATVGPYSWCSHVTDGTSDETQINAASLVSDRIQLVGSITIDHSIILQPDRYYYGNATVHQADAADIHVFFTTSADNVTIDGITIDGNMDAQTTDLFGIYITYAENVTIKNCRIYDCRSDGIFVAYGSDNARIENNVCWHNGENGICVILANESIIAGNTCYDNGRGKYGESPWNAGGCGIMLRDHDGTLYPTGNSVVSNKCYNNSQNGFWFADQKSASISDNSASSNTLSGFATGPSESGIIGLWDSSVVGNSFFKNRQYGMKLEHVANCSVVANTVTGNGVGGGVTVDGIFLVEPVDTTTFLGNIISDTGSPTQGYPIAYNVGTYNRLEWIGCQAIGNTYATVYSAGSTLNDVYVDHCLFT